jgi:EKC/KEOPS complex subunit CGI121/TPRKB
MPLTTLTLEHISPPHAVHISVYNSIANATFLRDQLLAGNAKFEYAFIDAGAVCFLVWRVP